MSPKDLTLDFLVQPTNRNTLIAIGRMTEWPNNEGVSEVKGDLYIK